jgi:AcrR family transcriptional regulator
VSTAYSRGVTDTRERLVEAGVARLEAYGPGGLTLRAVTRDAGVSHGAPRRHFTTFAGLLAAIAERGVADLEADLLAALGGDGPVEERIHRAVDAYLAFAGARPHMFALIFRHHVLDGGGRNLRERTLPLLDALADVIGDDGRAKALAIWTHAHGIAVLGLAGALDLAATADERRTLLRAAVRAHLSSAG